MRVKMGLSGVVKHKKAVALVRLGTKKLKSREKKLGIRLHSIDRSLTILSSYGILSMDTVKEAWRVIQFLEIEKRKANTFWVIKTRKEFVRQKDFDDFKIDEEHTFSGGMSKHWITSKYFKRGQFLNSLK